MGRIYDFHHANPTLVRLFLWEALHYRDSTLPNEAGRVARYEQKVAALAETFGTEASPKVAACLLSLIGLAAWPNAVPQMARMILGTTAQQPELRAFVVEFARQALAGSVVAPSE